MSDTRTLESIRFEAEEATYVEAGTDFRSGTRLYDSGVVGTVHLFLNGTELVAGTRLPAAFELSATVTEIYQMLATATTEGYARSHPFCCVCGAPSCTGVRWALERTDAELVLEMDDSIGNDLQAQTYRTQPDALRGALSALTETLLATLECADADATTAGTIREFQNWQRRTQGDPRGR